MLRTLKRSGHTLLSCYVVWWMMTRDMEYCFASLGNFAQGLMP